MGSLLGHLGEQLKDAIADVNESSGEGWQRRVAVGWLGGSRLARQWGCRQAERPCVLSSTHNAPPPAPSPSELAAASLGDNTTPLGKAVRILNNQLQALAQVDARSEELSARVNELHTR